MMSLQYRCRETSSYRPVDTDINTGGQGAPSPQAPPFLEEKYFFRRKIGVDKKLHKKEGAQPKI